SVHLRARPSHPGPGPAPPARRRGEDAHQGGLHPRPGRRAHVQAGPVRVGLLRPRRLRVDPVRRHAPDHGARDPAAGGDPQDGHPLPAGHDPARSLRAVTLNGVSLHVLAMISLGVYGLMMAGWASANNYALLGGQRAAALMISAEIAIGASLMGVVMVYGSLNMQDITRGQGQPLLPQFFGSWIPAWGILTQPLAFVIFLPAGIAATKRIPFDMPEGESEIIGYFVEY